MVDGILLSPMGRNINDWMACHRNDEDFELDDEALHAEPTDAPAGSPEKIEILRQRVADGMHLWHAEDRVAYEGLTGAIKPREESRRKPKTEAPKEEKQKKNRKK